MDTMRCPACKGTARKQKHEDRFECPCGWKSRLPEDKRKK